MVEKIDKALKWMRLMKKKRKGLENSGENKGK